MMAGEKWISTFWMRDGVSAERPWTIFDPTGIPILEESGAVEADGAMQQEELLHFGSMAG